MTEQPENAATRKQRVDAMRLENAAALARDAQAPPRPDGTYNFSREAFEQMANDYFGAS